MGALGQEQAVGPGVAKDGPHLCPREPFQKSSLPGEHFRVIFEECVDSSEAVEDGVGLRNQVNFGAVEGRPV